MNKRFALTVLNAFLSLCFALLPGISAAFASSATSYALVVGSNRPGAGQSPLTYAKHDADRFRAVLTELGGIMPGRIRTLYDPSAETLKTTLEALGQEMSRHRDADEPTSFVFYYSGHARATAINLGDTELKLADLRQMLERLPATFKLVVLDACQTGAISTVKGLQPAADFSYNSVNGLRVEGMAVLASSAGDELSQESERLEGSFFTHHLVAGLRGAADLDGDGRVTLNEAHRYTYNRTLIDTAETAVGRQHVTFETDMSGEGEMVLSWPSGAAAWIGLPVSLAGEVLIYRKPDKLVMAEVHKARAEAVTLAMPPGGYRTLIRARDRAYGCDTEVKAGTTAAIDLRECEKISLDTFTAKGAGARREHLFFEMGFGTLFKVQDRYVERLADFDYTDTEIFTRTTLHYRFAALVALLRYLQVGVAFGRLDSGAFETEHDGKDFEWNAYRLTVLARGRLPLARDRIVLFVEAGGGPAFGVTRYTDNGDTKTRDKERFVGYHAGGGGGLHLMPWPYIGFYLQGDVYYAPVIKNVIGDRHNSGGVALATGLRGGF
jgi:hypothetical protein